MSPAVEHRTVSLWPTDASPLRSGPPRPREAATSEALAAIASGYRRGRAGIIADGRPSGHSPTVPLTLLPRRTPPDDVPEVSPTAQAGAALTFWSRMVRSRRPPRRGRHTPRS